ncbi:MAG: hypothetical protein A2275_17845 [Bacteroidetes bacterium RIFOXYA12_FULL_35_11]|nr:MAG: hypothetical protein A2X01_08280 [Bacteroidetes bacterium GWF2_35_48]OFY76086.1 MAG: hypothetical protein A2275_17845 [Bacteroidetes bacterium RIFOXYA12_FULL_35_11]HBX51255.1 hypothetical protein [Bacteroidales bacterium]
MKYGFIFECHLDGPDYKVVKHIVENWMSQKIQFEPVTPGDKGALLEQCADSVEMLLRTKCDKVIIVWDLMPKFTNCNCIVEERNLIRQQLIDKNISLDKVEFIGIVHELESWLIADVSALERVLSTTAHPVKISKIQNPDREPNPKGKLRKIFKEKRGLDYSDLDYALKIIQNVQRPKDLKKSESFKRFYYKLTGTQL